jgi:hypothetical protein
MTEQALKSIIIDHHGNHWGPFESGVDAAKFAAAKWPEQDQADDNGAAGWKLAALWPPEMS